MVIMMKKNKYIPVDEPGVYEIVFGDGKKKKRKARRVRGRFYIIVPLNTKKAKIRRIEDYL